MSEKKQVQKLLDSLSLTQPIKVERWAPCARCKTIYNRPVKTGVVLCRDSGLVNIVRQLNISWINLNFRSDLDPKMASVYNFKIAFS